MYCTGYLLTNDIPLKLTACIVKSVLQIKIVRYTTATQTYMYGTSHKYIHTCHISSKPSLSSKSSCDLTNLSLNLDQGAYVQLENLIYTAIRVVLHTSGVVFLFILVGVQPRQIQFTSNVKFV